MPENFNVSGELKKLDSAATLGLLGTSNSLAYRVHEIEKHLHSYERWLGLAVTPNAEIHRADRVGVGVNPFVPDAGNADWGAWLQILGTSDTPATAGNVRFDLHRLMITAVERINPYFIQIGFGDSGAAALSAGTYTELTISPAANTSQDFPVDVQMSRQLVGTKGWIRLLCPGQNTATMSLYFGLHEYQG